MNLKRIDVPEDSYRIAVAHRNDRYHGGGHTVMLDLDGGDEAAVLSPEDARRLGRDLIGAAGKAVERERHFYGED